MTSLSARACSRQSSARNLFSFILATVLLEFVTFGNSFTVRFFSLGRGRQDHDGGDSIEALFSSKSNGKSEWVDEGGYGNIDRPNTPLDPALIAKLDETLGLFVTKAAIDTSSRYMLEFNNEIDQQWMMNFLGFQTAGFTQALPNQAGRWTDWLESLICTDALQIQVLMNPPKAILRGRSVNTDNRVRLEYTHSLEPRKMANQLLNVRNSITTEMIQDLGCIKTENVECVRYAYDLIESGADVAEKSRQITRMAFSGGDSTPLRDRIYLDLDIIITNFALEKVRAELTKNDRGLQFLDDIMLKLAKRDEGRSVLDRMLHEFYAPRELIEEVYLQGLQQGVDIKAKFNALAIADNLLQSRYSFALEANRILLQQDRFTRTYYKLIKDKGGFLPWKAAGSRAKIRVLDLQVEEQIQAASAAAQEAATLGMKLSGTGGESDDGAATETASSQKETKTIIDEEIKVDAATVVPEDDVFGSDASSFGSIVGPFKF